MPMPFQKYKAVRQVDRDDDIEDVEELPSREPPLPSSSNRQCSSVLARFLCAVLIPLCFLTAYFGYRGWQESSISVKGPSTPATTTTSSTSNTSKTTPATTTTTTPPPTTSNTSKTTITPATTARLKQQLEQCRTDPNQQCFMFSMKHSGLGSQLINLFVNQIYLKQVYGYTTMLVDCVVYEGYQRPDGEPVLTGYFTPDLAIFNYQHEKAYVEPLLPTGFDFDTWENQLDFVQRAKSKFKKLVKHHAGDLVMVNHMMFHTEARNWAKTDFGGYKALYRALVPSMCPHLQFKETIRQEMRELRHRLYPTLPDDLHRTKSVAFHVRRTDKLISEAQAYPSSAYVDQVVQILELEGTPLQEMEICFLATDDSTVHLEMQQALTAAGLSCRLVYTPPMDKFDSVNAGDTTIRYSTDAGFVFLTEFSVMLETNYFVGTFGSNVGALAAILRGCPGGYDYKNHFAHTYGVDRPHWYFR